MRIMAVGDVHGAWGYLNTLINSHRPDIILQCGDWGWFPAYHKRRVQDSLGNWCVWDNFGFKNKDTTIYWCDGNHEDHWSLRQLEDNQIAPNVYYMKRGSVITLPNGMDVMFMGGAHSVDKHTRTLGVDWFPEEVIWQREIMDLPNVNVDVVVSHTCPNEFVEKVGRLTYDDRDPSRAALSYILERYRPKQWYFGHWHTSRTGYNCRCSWNAMNMTGRTGWWKWIEKS